MNNEQENIKLEEEHERTQCKFIIELNQILAELLQSAIINLTAETKSDKLEFKEIKALMIGIRAGVELYSKGIATNIKYLERREYLIDYIYKFIELTYMNISDVMESTSLFSLSNDNPYKNQEREKDG
jgi:hypothetical protein